MSSHETKVKKMVNTQSLRDFMHRLFERLSPSSLLAWIIYTCLFVSAIGFALSVTAVFPLIFPIIAMTSGVAAFIVIPIAFLTFCVALLSSGMATLLHFLLRRRRDDTIENKNENHDSNALSELDRTTAIGSDPNSIWQIDSQKNGKSSTTNYFETIPSSNINARLPPAAASALFTSSNMVITTTASARPLHNVSHNNNYHVSSAIVSSPTIPIINQSSASKQASSGSYIPGGNRDIKTNLINNPCNSRLIAVGAPSSSANVAVNGHPNSIAAATNPTIANNIANAFSDMNNQYNMNSFNLKNNHNTELAYSASSQMKNNCVDAVESSYERTAVAHQKPKNLNQIHHFNSHTALNATNDDAQGLICKGANNNNMKHNTNINGIIQKSQSINKAVINSQLVSPPSPPLCAALCLPESNNIALHNHNANNNNANNHIVNNHNQHATHNQQSTNLMNSIMNNNNMMNINMLNNNNNNQNPQNNNALGDYPGADSISMTSSVASGFASSTAFRMGYARLQQQQSNNNAQQGNSPNCQQHNNIPNPQNIVYHNIHTAYSSHAPTSTTTINSTKSFAAVPRASHLPGGPEDGESAPNALAFQRATASNPPSPSRLPSHLPSGGIVTMSTLSLKAQTTEDHAANLTGGAEGKDIVSAEQAEAHRVLASSAVDIHEENTFGKFAGQAGVLDSTYRISSTGSVVESAGNTTAFPYKNDNGDDSTAKYDPVSGKKNNNRLLANDLNHKMKLRLEDPQIVASTSGFMLGIQSSNVNQANAQGMSIKVEPNASPSSLHCDDDDNDDDEACKTPLTANKIVYMSVTSPSLAAKSEETLTRVVHSPLEMTSHHLPVSRHSNNQLDENVSIEGSTITTQHHIPQQINTETPSVVNQNNLIPVVAGTTSEKKSSSRSSRRPRARKSNNHSSTINNDNGINIDANADTTPKSLQSSSGVELTEDRQFNSLPTLSNNITLPVKSCLIPPTSMATTPSTVTIAPTTSNACSSQPDAFTSPSHAAHEGSSGSDEKALSQAQTIFSSRRIKEATQAASDETDSNIKLGLEDLTVEPSIATLRHHPLPSSALVTATSNARKPCGINNSNNNNNNNNVASVQRPSKGGLLPSPSESLPAPANISPLTANYPISLPLHSIPSRAPPHLSSNQFAVLSSSANTRNSQSTPLPPPPRPSPPSSPVPNFLPFDFSNNSAPAAANSCSGILMHPGSSSQHQMSMPYAHSDYNPTPHPFHQLHHSGSNSNGILNNGIGHQQQFHHHHAQTASVASSYYYPPTQHEFPYDGYSSTQHNIMNNNNNSSMNAIYHSQSLPPSNSLPIINNNNINNINANNNLHSSNTFSSGNNMLYHQMYNSHHRHHINSAQHNDNNSIFQQWSSTTPPPLQTVDMPSLPSSPYTPLNNNLLADIPNSNPATPCRVSTSPDLYRGISSSHSAPPPPPPPANTPPNSTVSMSQPLRMLRQRITQPISSRSQQAINALLQVAANAATSPLALQIIEKHQSVIPSKWRDAAHAVGSSVLNKWRAQHPQLDHEHCSDDVSAPPAVSSNDSPPPHQNSAFSGLLSVLNAPSLGPSPSAIPPARSTSSNFLPFVPSGSITEPQWPFPNTRSNSLALSSYSLAPPGFVCQQPQLQQIHSGGDNSHHNHAALSSQLPSSDNDIFMYFPPTSHSTPSVHLVETPRINPPSHSASPRPLPYQPAVQSHISANLSYHCYTLSALRSLYMEALQRHHQEKARAAAGDLSPLAPPSTTLPPISARAYSRIALLDALEVVLSAVSTAALFNGKNHNQSLRLLDPILFTQVVWTLQDESNSVNNILARQPHVLAALPEEKRAAVEAFCPGDVPVTFSAEAVVVVDLGPSIMQEAHTTCHVSNQKALDDTEAVATQSAVQFLLNELGDQTPPALSNGSALDRLSAATNAKMPLTPACEPPVSRLLGYLLRLDKHAVFHIAETGVTPLPSLSPSTALPPAGHVNRGHSQLSSMPLMNLGIPLPTLLQQQQVNRRNSQGSTSNQSHGCTNGAASGSSSVAKTSSCSSTTCVCNASPNDRRVVICSTGGEPHGRQLPSSLSDAMVPLASGLVSANDVACVLLVMNASANRSKQFLKWVKSGEEQLKNMSRHLREGLGCDAPILLVVGDCTTTEMAANAASNANI